MLLSLHRKLFRKVFPAKSEMNFPGGYIPNRFIMDRIACGPVLVIGDYTGRDFFPLKQKFPDTKLLDIVDNNIAAPEDFILQSITQKTPFENEHVSAVVIGEVIEHLWEDVAALREIHRILVPGGKVLMTVPFFHDEPDYHFRIHSPKTIWRLLEHAGFEIIELVYRGTLIRVPFLFGVVALLLYPFWREQTLQRLNDVMYRLHCFLGKYEWLNRHSSGFGALIYARKGQPQDNALHIQQQAFQR